MNDSKGQNHSTNLFFKQKKLTGTLILQKKISLSKVEKMDANRYVINEFIICENNELTLLKGKGELGRY